MATAAAAPAAAAAAAVAACVGAGPADPSRMPPVCPRVAVAGLEGDLERFNGVYELWAGKINDGAPVWRTVDTASDVPEEHESFCTATQNKRLFSPPHVFPMYFSALHHPACVV